MFNYKFVLSWGADVVKSLGVWYTVDTFPILIWRYLQCMVNGRIWQNGFL